MWPSLWKYLDVGKTEPIYLVASNTLYGSVDHDAGFEVSRFRNLKRDIYLVV